MSGLPRRRRRPPRGEGERRGARRARREPRRVGRAGRRRDVVGLGLAVRPGRELVGRVALDLRRRRAERVGGALDGRRADRRGAARRAERHGHSRRVAGGGDVDGARVELARDRGRVVVRVRRRQLQLQVGRVLVVGRDERSAGRVLEALDAVLVAVPGGGAVVQDQLPVERRAGQRAVLGRRWRSPRTRSTGPRPRSCPPPAC